MWGPLRDYKALILRPYFSPYRHTDRQPLDEALPLIKPYTARRGLTSPKVLQNLAARGTLADGAYV